MVYETNRDDDVHGPGLLVLAGLIEAARPAPGAFERSRRPERWPERRTDLRALRAFYDAMKLTREFTERYAPARCLDIRRRAATGAVLGLAARDQAEIDRHGDECLGCAVIWAMDEVEGDNPARAPRCGRSRRRSGR